MQIHRWVKGGDSYFFLFKEAYMLTQLFVQNLFYDMTLD